MANVETRRDENNTFLRSGCCHKRNMRTHYLSRRGAARQFVYFIEIWARGGSRRQPVEATEREKRSKEGLVDFCAGAGARRPSIWTGEGSGAGNAQRVPSRLGLLLFGVYRKLSDQGP